ncbi:MAG: hypothetical protein WEG36_12340 [Gemmatimonadota bacterium]
MTTLARLNVLVGADDRTIHTNSIFVGSRVGGWRLVEPPRVE